MVAMSTPPLAHATGTCKSYEPECVDRAQKGLLIAGLALIAVGVAGNLVSLIPYLKRKMGTASGQGVAIYQTAGLIGVVVVPIVGAVALPYIRPPTLKFGIPAICSVIGTSLFLTAYFNRTHDATATPPYNSPLFDVFRVFVAASLKCFRSYPDSNKDYHGHEIGKNEFKTTRCLGGLHKAAIILPGEDTTKVKSWTLCTVEQVEEAKIAVRMVPMWMTFIVCGVVAAIGDTYFVEQAGKLNRNIGKLRLPIQVLLLVRRSTKDWLGSEVVTWFLKKFRSDRAPSFGIAAGMVCSILCCISAALVERKRLNVVRSHGLLDQPDEQIKMSIYWLLFQFVLLGGLEAFLENSVNAYYRDQSPGSVENYVVNFIRGVTGLGYMCSALSVYVVGKISEKGGRANWFQHSLNRSRLDLYYWVLAGMSLLNLVVFVIVASFYRYKKPEEGRRTPDAGGGYTDGYNEGDQNKSCCCFC